MRRIYIIAAVLLALASPAWATTVTAQVKDSVGNIYSNCNGSASFAGQNTTPGAGPYLLNGSPFQTVVAINCGGDGRFTTSLADNLQISPTPSQWRFSICAPTNLTNGPPPLCFNGLFTVTGATLDLTSQLQAIAIPLPTLTSPTIPIPNGAAGTACNGLVKLDSSGNAVSTVGGETSGVIGIALSGCGSSGMVNVAVTGKVSLLFDSASPTAGDYVGIASSAHNGTDVGSTPGSGQTIGRIIVGPTGPPTGCNAGNGCFVVLQIGTSSGGGSGTCTGCVQLNSASNQTITQSGGSTLNIAGLFNVQAGGSINAFQHPDSGTAAQSLATSNRSAFVSGTPGTNALPPAGTFQPMFVANVGGVSYATAIEALANRDQNSGYPSLTSLGQVPIAELIAAAGLAGCTSANFVKGDFSGCASSSASPAFSSITTGSNTAANMEVAAGGCLRFAGATCTSGSINSNLINGTAWPITGASVNSVSVVTSVGGGGSAAAYVFTNGIPNCTTAGGCALGYNSSAHTWTSNNVAGNAAKPMFLQPCNGTNGACPDTNEIIGIAADATFETFKIPAGTLGSDGQCVETTHKWKHSTGTSTAGVYKWWLGKDVQTQGLAIVTTLGTTQIANTTCSNAGNCNNTPTLWHLTVCRINTTLTTDAYTDQMQAGSGQFTANFNTSIAVDWTVDEYITLGFNLPITDKVTFWGGKVWYP